ncbi:hypothetical protein ACFJIX_29150 [Roseateles sp. UC29_93]|uniref:hypothetical protein n=1 Tax=Roseateles sp. UC29_93 TaxID=3350177 RepID=UPI0036729353
MVAQRNGLQALRGDAVRRRETPTTQARVDESPRMVAQRGILQALRGDAVQRRGAPVIQRYVTFDKAQELPVVLGHQGPESYDLSTSEKLLTTLFGNEPTDSKTFDTLGPFLTEAQHICFNSVGSAVNWILAQRGVPEKSSEPREEKEEEKKTASAKGGGIVWAYRMEGAPKSDKQRSDVAKNVTPQAALETILSEMGEKLEGQEKLIVGLREKWSEVALEEAPKKRADLATKLQKQLRSKTLDMKKLLLDVYAKKGPVRRPVRDR